MLAANTAIEEAPHAEQKIGYQIPVVVLRRSSLA